MKRVLFCFLTVLINVILFAQADTTPTPQWRPVYHFTPAKNWTNDPNGLLYLNGEYNLYNQQNPFENFWGHMSWGHAASTDLIHWKHLPIAIPENISGGDTTWIFSGSAVYDKNNTSGFCKNDGCVVAIYTAHSPNRRNQSQYIAYSNDGGKTFTNYDKNPVIDLNKLDFRDPNVFWYEPGKYWLMTVVIPDEHKARFYSSPNLKDWTLLSEFGPQGYTGANWECPFLIQLPVEGMNAKKWVLVISAAGGERGVFEQYFVGDFDGKEFKNDNPADKILPLDYGDTYYAAIPWNNTPGDKKIYTGWMIPNAQPTYPWRGQMSIARDMSLKQTPEGYRLIQKPTAVITKNLDGLSANIVSVVGLKLNNEEINIDKAGKIKGNAYWLDATLSVQSNAVAGFKIAQQKDADGKVINETIIGYDAASKQVFVDRTNAGGKLNENALKRIIDVNSSTIKLTILLDKSSLEVFVNDGEAVLTTYIYPGEHADKIAAFATGGSAEIKNVKIRDLSIVGK
ncbi:glycoside hydrolase family 32 protein [Parafilimonas sp.]|uniref:glycoside hydrolase family 32 protein n=1 Tax=Parafilimonas sp. TaxID=1969739 RepID=UPI0039E6C718